MRTMIFLFAMILGLQAQAATVTLKSGGLGNKLSDIPGTLLGILIDQGFSFKQDPATDLWTVGAQKIHCDYNNRGEVLGGISQIETELCRYNSENVSNTKKGSRFNEARMLVSLLTRIDDANAGTHFTDCASGGYCGTYLKSIVCTADPRLVINQGRWICTLQDGH